MSQSDAFFHRRTTHQWIRDLSIATDTTIYAGLGATIDRTGLTWAGLLDAMMARYVPEDSTRSAIESHYTLEQQATVLDGYRSQRLHSGKDPVKTEKQRIKLLRDEIRDVLYGPHENMQGKLAQSIVELTFQIASAGKSVAIVTPNYDQYLHVDLQAATDLAGKLAKSAKGVFVPKVSFYAVDDPSSPPMPNDWTEPGQIHVVYVHGYVAKDSSEDRGVPVVSEGDYGDRSGPTRNVLASLFRNRTVYVVGSSLADAPLVNALADTKPQADAVPRARVAILPSSSAIGETQLPSKGFRLWQDTRLSYIGVDPIYPDFHVQTGQFLHEIQKCMQLGDGDSMTDAYSPRRYGVRLTTWWRGWSYENVESKNSQVDHHNFLAEKVPEIRSAASIPLDENLKVEFWLRWKPESSRSLALWASSTGTWTDPYTMRRDEIAVGSEYMAVQIFCGGAPRFVSEAPNSPPRWKTYFGVPIWHETSDGRLPVAVVSLASMSEDGALNARNDALLRNAITLMQDIGATLVAI